MTRHEGLSQWETIVSTQLPHLSKPQAIVLAMWSFGMVTARSCGLSSVACFLAELLGTSEDTMRQRLREWYRGAEDKKGKKRRELDVETCFVPLLRWILSWWAADEKRLALAMDATNLGQQFTVLCISVVYRGCAIPVAWVIVAQQEKGAWKPHWLRLFELLRDAVPSDWAVIVLADRGLYASWLYRAIIDLRWHPFLRINCAGKFRRAGESEFQWLNTLSKTPGCEWSGRVICFVEHTIDCTLLVRWDEKYADPWLIVTDLPPSQANIAWYGMRAWIECGFKDVKRGGWQWQQTRITDPDRAARFWLAIAVATLWTVSVGGDAELDLPASTLDELPETHVARRKSSGRSRPRLLSCFRRGCLVIVSALIRNLSLPTGLFTPQPWPPLTTSLAIEKTYP